MRTCQEVHVHVFDGQRSDDALRMAAAAGLGPMVRGGTIEEVGLPLVIAPEIIPLINLPRHRNALVNPVLDKLSSPVLQ